VVTGETGPGSTYAFYVPNDWNGSVVYYAHGIRLPSAPIDLNVGDGFDAFRDALGARHYAVALSSFDENGFAVKDGAQRTHQLRGLFASQFGKPVRSYLAGMSLGGLMVEDIAESHGSQYDGTLAMCSPLGGSASEVNYLADVRVLFDWFYKGVLPGDVMNVPPGTNPDAAVGAAVAAIMANPTGLGAMLRIDQTPIEGTNGNEWVTSVAYAIKYNILALDDLTDHTHGHPFYDNSETHYSSSLPAPYGLDAGLLKMINGEVTGVPGVGRFTATPDALNYLDQYYKPTGALTIPTLTLHTTNDPFVPQRKHKREFLKAVTEAGATSLLVQRVVPGDHFGHCTFKPDEVTAAFDALTNWVENGVKPTA
jgi:alpha-beta hydrolase superfamily lysophospholipase